MARRKTKRRRRQKRFSVLAAVETYTLLDVASKGLTGLPLPAFLLADTGITSGMTPTAWSQFYGASGATQISLKEMLTGAQAITSTYHKGTKPGGGYTSYTQGAPVTEVLWGNLQANGVDMAIKMIAIPAGFKIGKRIAAPAIRRGNKLLKDIGMGMVKI